MDPDRAHPPAQAPGAALLAAAVADADAAYRVRQLRRAALTGGAYDPLAFDEAVRALRRRVALRADRHAPAAADRPQGGYFPDGRRVTDAESRVGERTAR